MLCADPTSSNFFLNEKFKCPRELLNDGIYAPSKSKLIASFMSFDKKNLCPFFLHKLLIFKITFLSIFLDW